MNPLDELPCAVLVTDRDGQVLAANQALLRLLGGDTVLRPGSLIDDLLPPAGRIFLQTHVWPMLLRDSEVHEIHLQLLDAQRQRVPVLLNARLGTHAAQDACYWTLFVARERHRFEAELVQARERAEASAVALGDSQRFVTAITDAIPGLVAYWDRDLRCRFANQAFADWFGIGPAAMVGLRLPQLLGAQAFEVEARPVAAVLAGQEQRFERALTLANGRRCQVLAHYIPDLVDGQVNGFYASVADVTRQHEASAALRTEMAARERVHGLLQASSAALQEAQRLGQIGNWHWQPSTGDIHWSPQLYQIMGHDPALPPLPLRELSASGCGVSASCAIMPITSVSTLRDT